MKPTPKQMVLLRYQAKKAWISMDDLVQWVEEWKVTITEICSGILWVKAK